MQSIVRFLGVVNAAIWFGGAVFFTLAVGPAFFSAEMLAFLPKSHAGRAAQVVLERYFLLQQVCAGLALLHLFIEHVHSGRPLERLSLGVLGVLLAIGLVGGYWLQPKMQALHRVKYSPATTPAQKIEAGDAFGTLHAVSQSLNLLALGGLFTHLWRITRPTGVARFGSSLRTQ